MKKRIIEFFTELSDKITYRHWIGIAAAASILLGLLVFFGLNSSGSDENLLPADTVQVVVAKQDIAPKTIIKESMLELREVPAYLLPDEAVRDSSEIVNKPARVQIMKDDMLTTRKVLMDISMAGFAGDIPPECRAVSIGITDVTGVAGFAKPGDYVDVMVISKGEDKMVGRIVLQEVQLLAINKVSSSQSYGNASNGDVKKTGEAGKNDGSADKATAQEGAISDLATATLAVLPGDALKLITEAQEGTLYLALRPYSPRDRLTTDIRYIHYSTTRSSNASAGTAIQTAPVQNVQPYSYQPAPSQGSAPAAAQPPASSGRVEVIRGTVTTREGA